MTEQEKKKTVNVEDMQAFGKVIHNKGIGSEGTCTTAAGTAAKTVTVGTTFSPVAGATLLVTFQNAITAASATLAVTYGPSGSTATLAAKPIYYRGAALGAGLVKAGAVLLLRYDGTRFNIVGDLDTDTNTVTDVAYDTTNKKLTKTVGVTQSDITTAAQIVNDGGATRPLDIELLPADYVFKPGDSVVMNGALYKCTAQTEATPFTLLAQDGKILYVALNGQKCYMVSSTTLNAGWEKVQDLDDKYYVEKRIAEEKADVTTTLKTQIEALTRHTRLTDFDLATLKKAVADQNLEKYGLKVGDYKTINGHDYVIAGLNPFKGTNSLTCTVDHVGLIVIPHVTQAWNASGNTNQGADNRGSGYVNSDLHYYLNNTLLPLVQTDLGTGNLIQHRKRLSRTINAQQNNRQTASGDAAISLGWVSSESSVDCYIVALSEIQVLGSIVLNSSYFDIGEANQQLEVFRHYRYTEIFGDEKIYLRDVASNTEASTLIADGSIYPTGVNTSRYVAALVLFH